MIKLTKLSILALAALTTTVITPVSAQAAGKDTLQANESKRSNATYIMIGQTNSSYNKTMLAQLKALGIDPARFFWIGCPDYPDFYPPIPDCPEQDIPDIDKPDTDQPNPDLPDSDKPETDNPNPDLPGNPDTDKPDTDEPNPDLPDNPDIDKPDTDKPDMDQPDSDDPDTDQPNPDKPDNDKPDTDNPTPSPDQPGTGNPDTDKPNPDQPGTGTPDTDKPNPDTGNPDNASSYAKQILTLVNAERNKAGLSSLKLDTKANNAASIRAKEIEKSFSHTRPNGSKFSSALIESGANFTGAGENIAWGQRSAEEVMNDWMNSPGHRANIMNTKFTHLGVGHYQNNSGTQYWAQLFMY